MFDKNKSKQKLDHYSKREVKKVMPFVKEIEALQPKMSSLTDVELQSLTEEFRFRLRTGETLDDIMVEAYAAIREADKRILGKEPYRVQLIGAIILHQGRVAELKTGEGKTLLGTLPAYLNALSGEGVHIVTVNEYLAKRDSDEMRQVHEFMGLSVGCVFANMKTPERQAQYDCDITYITNSEIGFDYLRDNMVTDKRNKVQRGLTYAIIDEVDSVLIDEARTPLIISGSSEKSTLFYGTCDILAKRMIRGEASDKFNKVHAMFGKTITETGDFIVDEKDKIITLTDEGIAKAERFLHIPDLSSSEHLEEYHGIITALRANHLMKKGVDYVVKDGEVLIVDMFTGRTMEGRRYADGLHQAIEAKERVKIQKESQTQATITYQNFFNKYQKKCGMTGTGKSEELEFREIYYMDVVEIPTNKPVIREDLPDLVFKTEKDKLIAVCEATIKANNKHQPVLIGVANINTSEKISDMLSERGIAHSVLNAKNDALEADIVAHAGELGRVTVATNMAGRGTDIKLPEEAKALGGLKIIGTERHESRRIDDQLRGRSGRQGDPGESQFYLSLDDDLMKHFAKEKWLTYFKKYRISEGQAISHKKLSKVVEEAQKHIEDNNYGVRKQVFEYDNANNQQREIIYNERNKALDGEDIHAVFEKAIRRFTQVHFDSIIDGNNPNDWDLQSLNEVIATVVPIKVFIPSEAEKLNREDFYNFVMERVITCFNDYVSLFSQAELRRTERQIVIQAIDVNWKTHLEKLEYLKQWVVVNVYGQKDPRLEYRRIANELMEETIDNLYADIVRVFFTGFVS